MKVLGTTTKSTERESIPLKLESIMMAIGSSPRDKDMANSTAISKTDIKAIGEMTKNREKELNMKVGTSMKDSSRVASSTASSRL
jgi:hypothetical protein